MKERIFIRKVGDTANGNHLEMWDERSVFLKHGVMTVRGKGRLDVPEAFARSRPAQRDAFLAVRRRCEDATLRMSLLQDDFGRTRSPAPMSQRRESTLRISFSSSKFISRPQTDDIAACREAKDRGTFEMPIFQREL
jgi:hypothetical protein